MSDRDNPNDTPLAAEEAKNPQRLLQLVYDELRSLAEARMRREAPGQTLQATALVHEAYMRLVDAEGDAKNSWASRSHFFGAAALAMRRILIERARARGAAKRGGNLKRLELDPSSLSVGDVPVELLDLDEALERLAEESPKQAELVNLRFFAGLTLPQAAEILSISISTAERHWAYARAWLYAAMKGDL